MKRRTLKLLVAVSALVATTCALADSGMPTAKPASEPEKPAQLAQALPTSPAPAGGQSAGAGQTVMGEERRIPGVAIAAGAGLAILLLIAANDGGGGAATQH